MFRDFFSRDGGPDIVDYLLILILVVVIIIEFLVLKEQLPRLSGSLISH